MNTKRVIVAVAGLLIALAAVFAIQRFLAARELEARWAQAREQRAVLERALRDAAMLAAAARQSRDALQSELAGLRRPVTPNRPTTAEVKRAGDDFPFSLKEVLEKDPKLQAMHLAAQRLIHRRQYDAFCRALGLTPEQTGKFMDAELAHDERLLDIDSTIHGQQLAEDDPAVVTLRKAADDELRAQQAELLGDAGYHQLEAYERTQPARAQTNVLAGRLALTDTPLTSEQADALTQVIANASNGYRAGGNVDVLDEFKEALANPAWRDPVPDNIDWAAVRENARAVLSPPQQAEFDNSITQFYVARIFNLAQAYTRRAKSETTGAGP